MLKFKKQSKDNLKKTYRHVHCPEEGPICACCGSEGMCYEMKPLPPYLDKVCGGCYKAISIHTATTCPIEELPLMINHPLERVRTIVNARLTLKKLDL